MASQFVSPGIGNSHSYPGSAAENRSVREQLDRLLASPHFCHSKRYPVFLRYVVEQTLEGRADELKERTIGIEVFQREPNYDTNLDPIVRVTAGEVRKRIAQYYHDSGSQDELRIDLPPGSYIPQFKPQRPREARNADPFAGLPALVEPLSPVESPSHGLPREFVSSPVRAAPASHRRWIVCGALAVLAASCLVAAAVLHRRQRPIESMWTPLLSSNTPVLISIGQHSTPDATADLSPNPPASPVSVGGHAHVNFIVFSDVQALTRITTMLAGLKQSVRVESASSTSYADLRLQPAILLGGFDNRWTERALSPLRFSFARDPGRNLYFIKDQRFPDSRMWSVDFNQDYAMLTRDYGIVARFTYPATHQVVLIVAGIGEDGTKAASEFVTDPESIRAFAAGAGNLSGQNFEAVIGTQVINGVSGPPQILAKYLW